MGSALATLISVSFLVLLIRRPTLAGQSFYGNLMRILGENGSIIVGLSFHPESTFLEVLLAVTLTLDAVYVVLYFKKAKTLRAREPH